MTFHEKRHSPSRLSILEAANRVVAQHGASHLTIDAVARESGLSKGGVLYHFPTKDRLLEGMLERVLETCNALIAADRQRLAGSPSPTLRAMVRACMPTQNDLNGGLGLSIMAAAAQRPALLERILHWQQEMWAQVQRECTDCALAGVLMVAADGLFVGGILGISPHTIGDRTALLQRIDDLARTAGT